MCVCKCVWVSVVWRLGESLKSGPVGNRNEMKGEWEEGHLKTPAPKSCYPPSLFTSDWSALKSWHKHEPTGTDTHSYMRTVHTPLCISFHQVHAAHKRTNILRKGLLNCKWHYTAHPLLSQCAVKTHTRTAFRSQQISMKLQQYFPSHCALKIMCDQRNLDCNPSGTNSSTHSFSWIWHS